MDESTTRSRHPNSMRQAFLLALLPTCVLFLCVPSLGDAQVPVETDITSSGLGTEVQPPSGGVYNIIGGTRPGGGPNLFHSFGDFSIGQGDIANFLNDSALMTTNIIGRVTGGNMSNIDGIIQTTGFGTANVFLVNPSGIVFGPNGSFDVGGSVSFSTAQYLRLFDGDNSANFYANPANDGLANSVFAMAPVVDFGFLSPAAYGFLTAPDPSATITVMGSALSVDPDQSISLVGGDISIQQAANVSAPGGHIHLVSVASPGEVLVPSFQTGPNINGASFTTMGTVTLKEGATLDVSGQFDEFGNLIGNGNSGTVLVRGGQLLLMDASRINASTWGSVNGLSTAVDIQVSQKVALTDGSTISTATFGSGSGGDVQIIVGNLSLDGAETAITTQVFGDGEGGNITANVGTLSMANGAVIQSQNFSVGTDVDGDDVVDIAGIGGDVIIQGLRGPGSPANSVRLDTSAAIKTETLFGPGRGGNVSMTADRVLLDNTSEVFTNTFVGNGAGGNLVLNVGTLMLKGGSAIRTTEFTFGTDFDFDEVPDPGSTGSGGHVTIQGITGGAADSVLLSGGSQIKSESLSGDGGRLFIAATDLNLDGASTLNSRTDGFGRGGDIVVNVQQASFSGGASIDSRTTASGTGGTITVQGLAGDGIKAKALTLDGFSSRILSESEGSGRPGDIEVHAKTVSLTDRAAIEAGTEASNGTGGKVSINADSVGIAGGSLISSQAFAQDAGQVTITADQLSLDNGSIVTATASVFGGRGGDVVLNVGTVSLANGATINSSTSQTGRAGDITMNVGSLTLADHSEITSSSTGAVADAGDAGSVTIKASGSFTSNGSKVTTSAENARGGDILIDAQSVLLSNGTLISASSNAPFLETGDGNAGNIAIKSASNVVMQNSSVTTEASQASGGQIKITAPDMVRLINSRISTSVGGLAGKSDGGNINIDPQFVILQNSQILAQAVAGAGGAIDIIATSAFIADADSIVSASSTLGISGTVNIQSPLQNVGGRLAPLSQQFSSAAALLAQQCAARAADGKFSTFVVAGREGLPVALGGSLASPSLMAEQFGSIISKRGPHSQFPAVTGAFTEYDARPIQLAKFGGTCYQ